MALVERVKKGQVILLLGSGALIGARLPAGKIPIGHELRDLLNEQFLGGHYGLASLQHVSDLAISQTSLITVQDFIRDYFSEPEPADFHLKIPQFTWRALFTTNYDRLLETCYDKSSNRVQAPELILQNSDSIDRTRTHNQTVPIIKLHGCVTRTHDVDLPLILTVEQYNDSLLANRSRLFQHLYDLAYENTIVFVGHSLQDANIRAVLDKVQRESPNGLRHFLLSPGVTDIEIDFWAEKKISALSMTFEEFLSELEASISSNDRSLAGVRPISEVPIKRRFTSTASPSDELQSFLTTCVEFVHSDMPLSTGVAEEFYRGESQSWHGIHSELAVKRSLESQILDSIYLKPDGDRASNTELYVIKGEAGSGKSIFLRQCAWRAQIVESGIILWANFEIQRNFTMLEELAGMTGERLFLVWDDAALNATAIERVYKKALSKNMKLTIITAERYSEWNNRCENLDQIVAEEYSLHALNQSEVENLVDLLDQHNCLGPNLIGRSREERVQQFLVQAQRQLLVALYETTSGRSFEDIILDEYSQISLPVAQSIYLTICTLNRFRTPVRAGLISRVHDISFEKFRSDFINPLEMIVKFNENDYGDVNYTARHPEIAEIVFNRVLDNSDDRFNEYIRILSKINISYESDRTAFRRFVNAKELVDLFASHETIVAIYDKAVQIVGRDPYLLQQIANYERIRVNGNFRKALDLLTEAQAAAPKDGSIVHSMAVLWRTRAEQEESVERRRLYRGEARTLLNLRILKMTPSPYNSGLLLELALDDFEDAVKSEESTDRSIDEQIRRAEQQLIETKRKFPTEQRISILEARFARILQDEERALNALKKSFEQNNRDPFLASRLAKTLSRAGRHSDAVDLLRSAVDRNRSDQRLNFQLAETLREDPSATPELLEYYYRRSYTPLDNNINARFWHARYSFEVDSMENGEELFKELRNTRTSFSEKRKIRDKLKKNGVPSEFYGAVTSINSEFGFIRREGNGDELFVAHTEFGDLWPVVKVLDRVRFNIGFTLHGPVCINIQPG